MGPIPKAKALKAVPDRNFIRLAVKLVAGPLLFATAQRPFTIRIVHGVGQMA